MYHSYRGPVRRRRNWAAWIFVPAALLLIALVAGSFVLQDYIVYTSDGFHFDFGEKTPADPPQEAQPAPAVEVLSEFTPLDTPEVSVEAGALPPEEALYLRAAYISPQSLSGGNLPELLRAAAQSGYNTVVFDIKTPDGKIAFPSALSQAVDDTESGALADAVASAKENGLRVIGRITCFQDNLTPRSFPAMAFRTASGATWLDYSYTSWLNPYSSSACGFLQSLALEAEALGFDELLLDSVCFPTLGKTALIRYGETDGQSKTEAVAAFVRALCGAVEIPVGVRLESVKTDGEAEGQNAALLSAAADCLWLTAGTEAPDGVPEDTLRLIYPSEPETPLSERSFAVLPSD